VLILAILASFVLSSRISRDEEERDDSRRSDW